MKHYNVSLMAVEPGPVTHSRSYNVAAMSAQEASQLACAYARVEIPAAAVVMPSFVMPCLVSSSDSKHEVL